jgi:hypothetical protein
MQVPLRVAREGRQQPQREHVANRERIAPSQQRHDETRECEKNEEADGEQECSVAVDAGAFHTLGHADSRRGSSNGSASSAARFATMTAAA